MCGVNKCIYCHLDCPPRDNLSFTKALVDVVCECFTLLYIKIYPVVKEIVITPTSVFVKDMKGNNLCRFGRDNPVVHSVLFWFMIFYGEYGDSVYGFELTDAKGKPIPNYRLPPHWTFNKLPHKPV